MTTYEHQTLDRHKTIVKHNKEQIDLQYLIKFQLPLKPLAKFEGNIKNEEQSGILFNAVDYLELVDYTGRIVKKGKRGAIN